MTKNLEAEKRIKQSKSGCETALKMEAIFGFQQGALVSDVITFDEVKSEMKTKVDNGGL